MLLPALLKFLPDEFRYEEGGVSASKARDTGRATMG